MKDEEKEVGNILPPRPTIVESRESPVHLKSYNLGFADGFKTSQVISGATLLCGIVMLVVSTVIIIRHSNRLIKIISDFHKKISNDVSSSKFLSLFIPVLICILLTGCTSNKIVLRSPDGIPATEILTPPAPVPPMEEPEQDFRSKTPEGTIIVMEKPLASSAGPQKDDPAPLCDLLIMKPETTDEKNAAVKSLRPNAIREAAQLVTIQTALAWRYGHLLDAVYRHSEIMDKAFNFGPLMITQGQALILPPVLARAGASMRIEDDAMATTASTSFELIQNARYVGVVPHWRTYLMADAFPKPEPPNPAVLPKTAEERLVWREAVRAAWAQGVHEADELFVDNVSRMVRDYRGIMLYHLLTAQHLLTRVQMSDADLGIKISSDGQKLNLGQRVYRITGPSNFVLPQSPQKKRR